MVLVKTKYSRNNFSYILTKLQYGHRTIECLQVYTSTLWTLFLNKYNILGTEYNKSSYLLIHASNILPCYNETMRWAWLPQFPRWGVFDWKRLYNLLKSCIWFLEDQNCVILMLVVLPLLYRSRMCQKVKKTLGSKGKALDHEMEREPLYKDFHFSLWFHQLIF